MGENEGENRLGSDTGKGMRMDGGNRREWRAVGGRRRRVDGRQRTGRTGTSMYIFIPSFHLPVDVATAFSDLLQ